jgi:peptide/nickel transport system permease protein
VIGGQPFARRIVHTATVLLGLSVVAFLLIHLVPGDPVRISLGPKATQAAVDATRHRLGLDKSLVAQYGDFLKGIFRGDLGYSIEQHASVSSLLGPRIAPSIFLLAYSTLVALCVGIPLGILSALRRDRLLDHAIRLGTMVTFAMPSFWLALVLVEIAALRLRLLPVSGYGGGFGHELKDLLLPALTIGLYLAPMLVRTLRGSVIDALASDYVEAARARGYSQTRVVAKHVLRNASMATITVLAVNLGFLVSGTVVIEVVFDIPGLGSLLINAVQTRDFPLVQALTLFFGALVVMINLASDVAYALVDPRVRAAR